MSTRNDPSKKAPKDAPAEAPAINNTNILTLADILTKLSEFGDVEVAATVEKSEEDDAPIGIDPNKLHDMINDPNKQDRVDVLFGALHGIRITFEFTGLTNQDEKLISEIEEIQETEPNEDE